MRIWHWMAAVLAFALALALMARAPMLGLIAIMDVAVVACGAALIRFEPVIWNRWSWAARRGDGPASWLDRVTLAWIGFAVVAYQAAIALVMATVFVLLVL